MALYCMIPRTILLLMTCSWANIWLKNQNLMDILFLFLISSYGLPQVQCPKAILVKSIGNCLIEQKAPPRKTWNIMCEHLENIPPWIINSRTYHFSIDCIYVRAKHTHSIYIYVCICIVFRKGRSVWFSIAFSSPTHEQSAQLASSKLCIIQMYSFWKIKHLPKIIIRNEQIKSPWTKKFVWTEQNRWPIGFAIRVCSIEIIFLMHTIRPIRRSGGDRVWYSFGSVDEHWHKFCQIYNAMQMQIQQLIP